METQNFSKEAYCPQGHLIWLKIKNKSSKTVLATIVRIQTDSIFNVHSAPIIYTEIVLAFILLNIKSRKWSEFYISSRK